MKEICLWSFSPCFLFPWWWYGCRISIGAAFSNADCVETKYSLVNHQLQSSPCIHPYILLAFSLSVFALLYAVSQVVVIGGGVSGLTCAISLAQQGFEVPSLTTLMIILSLLSLNKLVQQGIGVPFLPQLLFVFISIRLRLSLRPSLRVP